MDFVVDQPKQEPHDIPQYKGGDQVPVDDVTETSDAPKTTDAAIKVLDVQYFNIQNELTSVVNKHVVASRVS